jgi:hypothetical protein
MPWVGCVTVTEKMKYHTLYTIWRSELWEREQKTEKNINMAFMEYKM